MIWELTGITEFSLRNFVMAKFLINIKRNSISASGEPVRKGPRQKRAHPGGYQVFIEIHVAQNSTFHPV